MHSTGGFTSHVPIRVDAWVSDQKALHVDRVRLVDQLLCERRPVVAAIGFGGDQEIITLELLKAVEPVEEELEVVHRRVVVRDVRVLGWVRAV